MNMYTEEQFLLGLEILRFNNLRGNEIRFEDILAKVKSESKSNIRTIPEVPRCKRERLQEGVDYKDCNCSECK